MDVDQKHIVNDPYAWFDKGRAKSVRTPLYTSIQTDEFAP